MYQRLKTKITKKIRSSILTFGDTFRIDLYTLATEKDDVNFLRTQDVNLHKMDID